MLNELRSVSQEVGGLAEARLMPTEVRKWWLNEIRRETERFNGGDQQMTRDGRKMIRDVPRAPRGT